MLFSNKDRVGIRVRTTYSVWLVIGYAHVLVLLSVVVVTLPFISVCFAISCYCVTTSQCKLRVFIPIAVHLVAKPCHFIQSRICITSCMPTAIGGFRNFERGGTGYNVSAQSSFIVNVK